MAIIGSSTNKNDVIVSTSTTNDTVDGGNGNDIIDGGYGDDTIYGGNGKDLLFGGVGNDWLYGGNGVDTVYGGAGNDYINSRYDGSGSNDNGPDVIFGDGFDGVKRNADGTVFVATSGAYIYGSYDAFDNFIEGARTDFAGADLIYGGNGSEVIYGDNGLVDGYGNPLPNAPGGNDTIFGGNGNDEIFGEGGDDILVGELGADTLTGGSGNDRFVYYSAAESSPANGIDRITDFSPGDAIVVMGANFASQPASGNGTTLGINQVQIGVASGVTTIYVGTDSAPGADLVIQLDGTFAASDFEVSGNEIRLRTANVNHGPSLTGDGVADQSVDENSPFHLTVPSSLFTDPDGDALTYSATLANGSELPGWLSFNAATRTFSGTPLQGDEGVIEVKVTATDPHGLSASDVFKLTVADANDIVGTSGNDILVGTLGNDVLIGGPGDDTLTGGSGVDLYKWLQSDQGTATTSATDTITDFDSVTSGDKLDLRDILVNESHVGNDPGNLANYLHFQVAAGTTTLSVMSAGTGGVDQVIVLQNFDASAGGSLVGDNVIIQQLLTLGKLITD